MFLTGVGAAASRPLSIATPFPFPRAQLNGLSKSEIAEEIVGARAALAECGVPEADILGHRCAQGSAHSADDWRQAHVPALRGCAQPQWQPGQPAAGPACRGRTPPWPPHSQAREPPPPPAPPRPPPRRCRCPYLETKPEVREVLEENGFLYDR